MKVSKAEMAKKMEVAQTQVKLLNIHVVKSINEAKDKCKGDREAILTNVRSDEGAKPDQLIKHSVVQESGRQTPKRNTFRGDSAV